MAIIRRNTDNGEIRYQVKVRDPFGQWYPSDTFNTKADAERYERQLKLQKDRGSIAATKERREMTFGEYWEFWSNECRHRVSDGWRSSQDMMARKYLLPMFEKRKLLEIRSQDIGLFLSKLERQGLSPQSLLHLYNMLHKMFGDAVEFFEILDANPVRRRFRPKIHQKERNFLSPAESWKLLETCKDHPLGAAVWISLLAGLRPGEIQALKWSSIDFERGQILIRATFNRKTGTVQDHPKQKDWGRAPMPEPLANYLRTRVIGYNPDDFVCPSMWDGMFSYECFARKVLPRFCKLAGVRRLTPHELRHSCTELYVEQGASAEDLRRLLNHKSLSATIRYIHRTDERLSGLASKIQKPETTPPTEPPRLRLVKES